MNGLLIFVLQVYLFLLSWTITNFQRKQLISKSWSLVFIGFATRVRNKAHYEVIAEFSRPTECFPPWMLGRLLVTRAPSCLHCLQLYIVSHHLLWSKFHQGAILVLKCLHYNVVSKLHVAHSNQTHDPELYKGVQMWPEQGLEKPYCICEKWNKEKPEFCNFSHSFPRTRQQWGHWFQEQLMNIFKLLIYRNCTDASIHSARILTI